jgi:uncharacterized protein YkwD
VAYMSQNGDSFATFCSDGVNLMLCSTHQRRRFLGVATLAVTSLFVAAPSEGRTRPRPSKPRKVATLPVTLQPPAAPATSSPPRFVGVTAAPTDADTAEVFALVNDARIAAGLAPFSWDPHLATMAVDWSTNMSTQGFRHRENSTVSLPSTVRYHGENIAWGLRTPVSGLHQSLMDSPGHRANLLSTKSSRIGIGVVHVGEETWITQNFGSDT